jgi:hypothetical protein
MNSRGNIGEQGVSLVIAELLARDFKPYRPVMDDHGIDLMLSTGVSIQVKTANLSQAWARDRKLGKTVPTGKMMYQFSLQRTIFGTKQKLQSVGITYEYRDISQEADYLILVGLNERRFWIVPTKEIAGCKHVALAQGESRAKYGLRSRFWHVVRSGEGGWHLLNSPLESEPIVDISVLSEKEECVATLAGPIAA